jgi:hypothetical protein
MDETNLLANAGFESGGLEYWSYTLSSEPSCEVTIDDGGWITGQFCVNLKCYASLNGSNYTSLTQRIDLDNAAVLSFDYDIWYYYGTSYDDAHHGATLTIYIDGTLHEQLSISGSTGQAHYYSDITDMYTGVKNLTFELHSWTEEGDSETEVRIDNVCVTRKNTAGTYDVSSLSDLENMANDLFGTYNLSANIDASDTQLSTYNNGEGWVPIGTIHQPFFGKFNGNGYTIDGLKISDSGLAGAGLFGYMANEAEITDVNLTNVDVSADQMVGSAVGYALETSVTDVETSGTINGNKGVGGIVGYIMNGNIHRCKSTCSLGETNTTSNMYIGGILGVSRWNSVTRVFYEGTSINVPNKDYVGGIMGIAMGSLDHDFDDWHTSLNKAYVSTDITANDHVGGIIGHGQEAYVSECQYRGNISGNINVGGIVGASMNCLTSNCAASGGTVDGDDYVGGLNGVSYMGINSVSTSFSGMDVTGAGTNVHALTGSIEEGQDAAGSYADEDVSTVPANNSY